MNKWFHSELIENEIFKTLRTCVNIWGLIWNSQFSGTFFPPYFCETVRVYYSAYFQKCFLPSHFHDSFWIIHDIRNTSSYSNIYIKAILLQYYIEVKELSRRNKTSTLNRVLFNVIFFTSSHYILFEKRKENEEKLESLFCFFLLVINTLWKLLKWKLKRIM